MNYASKIGLICKNWELNFQFKRMIINFANKFA